MMNRVLHNLGIGRTSLLILVALAAVALPVGYGIVKASQDPASTQTPANQSQQTPARPVTSPNPGTRPQVTSEKKDSQGWLEQIEAAGYRDLNIDQLIGLKEHDIDADYIRQVRAAGFELNADQLVRFKEHEITNEFINEMA